MRTPRRGYRCLYSPRCREDEEAHPRGRRGVWCHLIVRSSQHRGGERMPAGIIGLLVFIIVIIILLRILGVV